MSDYEERFINENYFRMDYDEREGRENYYDLSFGTHDSRTTIPCHKNHLKELLRELSAENFDYFSDCGVCGDDINVGDEYYNLPGDHVHKDCIKQFIEKAEEEI